jgi:DNA-directed RNA polymerase specialized sigma24 family protein
VSGVSVLELLDREWGRLGVDAGAARRLADVCGCAGGAGSLAEVERFVRAASAPEADAVLVALAARAVEGDGLAARVLLQLLMPGVRRLARTWWALGDADERASAAVAAVYDRIRRYPLARRPRRIAANVLMDAASDLRRAVRPSFGGEHGEWNDDRAAVESVHPAVELAEVLAEAVRGGLVSAADAELIAASRIAGVSLADIAERRGAKLRTLQWRRRRAEEALTASGRLVAA